MGQGSSGTFSFLNMLQKQSVGVTCLLHRPSNKTQTITNVEKGPWGAFGSPLASSRNIFGSSQRACSVPLPALQGRQSLLPEPLPSDPAWWLQA